MQAYLIESFFSFRWTKNGETFHAEQNNVEIQSEKGTLIFSQPGDSDEGVYRCFVENFLGIATSDVVIIRRVKLEEIENESERVIEKTQGDSLIVPPCARCIAYSNDWHVEWVIEQSGSDKPLDGSRISYNDEGSLFFSHVDPSDASVGLQFVNVLRHKKLTEITRHVKSFKLQIIKRDGGSFRNPKPLYLTPPNVLGQRGETLKLSCIYSGVPVPQVTWYRNGSIIQVNDHDDLNGPHLVIKNVTLDDQTLYTCSISYNSRIEARYGIYVTVTFAPYFTSELNSILVEPGTHFYVVPKIMGVPEPEVQWFYNGVPYLDNEMHRRRINSNNFIIYSADRKDTGNYGCNISNSFGYAYKDFNVRVDAIAPRLLRKPQNLTVFEGSTVILYCDFYGIPQPSITWDIEQHRSMNGDRYKQDMRGKLAIHNVSLSDAGSYKCEAKNSHGSGLNTVELTVWKHTQILGEMVHYEIPAGNNVTIGCDVSSDQYLDVEVKWHKFNDILSGPRFIHNPVDNSLTIIGLTDRDVGVYQCSASTNHDEVLSDRAVVKRMVVPQLPRLTLESCDLGHATFLVQNQGNNGPSIEHYRIEYNTSQAPEHWRIALAELKPTDLRFRLELGKRTKYSWKAIAVNQWGDSMPSLVTNNCSTSTGTPFRNPANLRAGGSTPGTLTVTWDPVSEEEQNGADFRYALHWKNLNDVDWNIEYICDWKNTSVTLQSLYINERHRVKVTAENELGSATEVADEIIEHSGEDSQIFAPYNLDIIEVINEQSILIGWNPFHYRGRITKFTVHMWNEDDLHNIKTIETMPFITTTVVTGLKPRVYNYLNVKAHSKYYESLPSETVKIFMR